MSIGVIGNTSDFGSEESRFEPLMDNHISSLTYWKIKGRLAEWSIAAVLKTVVPKGTVGSNPTPSATITGSRGVRFISTVLGTVARRFESCLSDRKEAQESP